MLWQFAFRWQLWAARHSLMSKNTWQTITTSYMCRITTDVSYTDTELCMSMTEIKCRWRKSACYLRFLPNTPMNYKFVVSWGKQTKTNITKTCIISSLARKFFSFFTQIAKYCVASFVCGFTSQIYWFNFFLVISHYRKYKCVIESPLMKL